MALTPSKNLTKYGRIARFNDFVEKGLYTYAPSLKDTYDIKFRLTDNLNLEIKEYYDDVEINSVSLSDSGYELAESYSHHSNFEDLLQSTHDSFIESYSDLIKNGRIASNDDGIIRRDSLSRTRQLLIDYACMHESEWKSFITLTISDSSIGIDSANKKFSYFIDKWRRSFSDFKYLGVPEYQKRGAIHYHILTNVPCGSDLIPKQPLKKIWSIKYQKHYDLEYYDIKHWDLGFTTAFNFELTDDTFNVALYITKYLYKDIDNRLFGRNKILKSNNLKKADYIKLKHTSINYINAMQYLKEKGYNLDFTTVNAANSFTIPFDIASIKLSREDYNIIEAILKDNLPF